MAKILLILCLLISFGCQPHVSNDQVIIDKSESFKRDIVALLLIYRHTSPDTSAYWFEPNFLIVHNNRNFKVYQIDFSNLDLNTTLYWPRVVHELTLPFCAIKAPDYHTIVFKLNATNVECEQMRHNIMTQDNFNQYPSIQVKRLCMNVILNWLHNEDIFIGCQDGQYAPGYTFKPQYL